MDYEIITESSNQDVSNKIRDGLEDFNMGFFRKKYDFAEVESFVIYAKDDLSQIVGGLCGCVFESDAGAWAVIDCAWIEEDKRQQGIGTQLFEKAEILAQEKNCRYVQLHTSAYQAVDFYKKLGFECVGIIPQWIEDHDAVFFRKKLN